jgi:type IV secretory pathway TrbD component
VHRTTKRSTLEADLRFAAGEANTVIILGIILLIVGFVLKISILWTIGIILAIIGVILWILGAVGRPIAGRRHWY